MFGGNKKFMCASCGKKHDPNIQCQVKVPVESPIIPASTNPGIPPAPQVPDMNAIKTEATKDIPVPVPQVPQPAPEPQVQQPQATQEQVYACRLCGAVADSGKLIGGSIVCSSCIDTIKGSD